MILVNGKLNYGARPHGEALIFTGNSYINREGKLVMGRGAAREVRNKYPGIDLRFGKLIPHMGFYGLLLDGPPSSVRTPIYAFQVKYDWSMAARPELIERSGRMLKALLDNSTAWTFHMNMPGVGNGRLGLDEVMQIIESLQFSDQLYMYYVR